MGLVASLVRVTCVISTLPLESTSAPELCIISFVKWVSLAGQLHISLTVSVPRVGLICVKRHHWILEQWKVFCELMNYASLIDHSGFGGCQEKATYQSSADSKVCWRKNNGLGAFSPRVEARQLYFQHSLGKALSC